MRLASLRNRAFFASDLVLLPTAAIVAFAARYEGPWPADAARMLWAVILIGVPTKLLLLVALGLYSRLWRYASVADLERLLLGAGACAAVDVVLGLAVMPALGIIPHRLSYAVILLDACLGALA